MSFSFHLTNEAMHILSRIGLWALSIGVLVVFTVVLCSALYQTYQHGYQEGLEVGKAKPKTKMEAHIERESIVMYTKKQSK